MPDPFLGPIFIAYVHLPSRYLPMGPKQVSVLLALFPLRDGMPSDGAFDPRATFPRRDVRLLLVPAFRASTQIGTGAACLESVSALALVRLPRVWLASERLRDLPTQKSRLHFRHPIDN